jgi:hypothetical protein
MDLEQLLRLPQRRRQRAKRMKNPAIKPTAHSTARASAHQTARQEPAATAAPHGRTPQCGRARMHERTDHTPINTHAGLTHVCTYPCGGVRPCAPAASAGCGRAVRRAPPVRSPVRALFTHTHSTKKEREMDKKQAKTALEPVLRIWNALSIPSHRTGKENAKMACSDGSQP